MSDKQVNIAVLKLHQSCGGKGNCVYQRRGSYSAYVQCGVRRDVDICVYHKISSCNMFN